MREIKKNKEEIVEAIKIIWDSLDSHLLYSYKKRKNEKRDYYLGDAKWHKAVMRGYIKVINVLLKQL